MLGEMGQNNNWYNFPLDFRLAATSFFLFGLWLFLVFFCQLLSYIRQR